MSWTPAFPLDELPNGQARLLRTDTHRVAVFRLDDDSVHAVDNACPHEGYPLVQGEVRGRVLTCVWHNFKFSLESGACLKGDEDVRTYGTRVVDGVIEVDLSVEDPVHGIANARRSLEEAVREGQAGRAARDVVRLLHAGLPAAQILADGAGLDARHGQYGTTHATPVAVDLLEYLRGEAEHDTLVIMQMVELLIEANVRRPAQEWPDMIVSADFENDLSAAIESEDRERALGLVRGASDRHDVGAALLRCASEHFLGFGHPLIYATKILELLERDARHAREIWCGLALRILSSTREDTLPPMRHWREEVLRRRFTRDGQSLGEEQVSALAARILDPSDGEIEAEFLDRMEGNTAADSLVDVLVTAAGERLLRFDPSIHDDWTVQDSWLAVTHPLTHAHAIREALDRADRPQLLSNLAWSLAFIRRSHRLELPAPPQFTPVPATVEDIVAALAHRDPRVVPLAAGWLQSDADPAELAGPLQEWLLAGQAVQPIFFAHQIKTLRVGLQEARLRTPLLGTLRYLAHPVAERGTRGDVHDAVQLVIHGNLPKRRAS